MALDRLKILLTLIEGLLLGVALGIVFWGPEDTDAFWIFWGSWLVVFVTDIIVFRRRR